MNTSYMDNMKNATLTAHKRHSFLTRRSPEPEFLTWKNLYLKMTIVHFIIALTIDQLIILSYS